MFQTIGDETEPGKVVELQRAFGKILEDLADASSPSNPILQRLASLMIDAEPKGPILGKNRRIHLQYLVTNRKLEEWLEPFIPKP